jgi:endoglucanase
VNNLVKRLVELEGPSGREGPVRQAILQEIEGLVDEISISPLGSIHAIKNPGMGKKIMFAAHMDEIGVIISHIGESGFARFHGIGGINPQTLVGHRVRFGGDNFAVIGIEDPSNLNQTLRLDKLFLDFGCEAADECPVEVGDIGVFHRPFLELGQRWVAKAMDDRIGVAILIETIRTTRDLQHEAQFTFTVQEEVGLRGARTSGYALQPDLAIAVDVTRTGDTPKGVKMAVKLGAGPAIKVRDSGMISDPRIVDLLVSNAERKRIPYQMEVLEKGTTDAAAIQLSRSGVPAGCVSIPTRYIHSPSEMVDRFDVENAVALLSSVLVNSIDFE